MTQFTDETRNCIECKGSFLLTVSEQQWFEQQGFTPPKRCKPCRDKRKAQNQQGQQGQTTNARPAVVVQNGRPAAGNGTPVVQYRDRGAAEVFSQNYSAKPAARPAAAPVRGKKEEERRTDAYSERRERKRNDWRDQDGDG